MKKKKLKVVPRVVKGWCPVTKLGICVGFFRETKEESKDAFGMFPYEYKQIGVDFLRVEIRVVEK